MRPRFLVFFVPFLLATTLFAQSRQSVQWRYIENYKDMAVDQMQRYRIPASITLAQGLCESAAGQSQLAREAHNHFGIKVGSDWAGPYMILSDDRPDDRFRKYRTDDESFEDHSRFLSRGQRYRSLFNLNITDYKGWAHGLKRCGYATNPRYASMLIDIIERYNLQQFDSPSAMRRHTHSANNAAGDDFYDRHIVYRINKTYMIIAMTGDTWESVAKQTGVSRRKLLKYNERPKDSRLAPGDVVYLQKKRTRGDKSLKGVPHVVQPGESMYDIAQHYAIRLSSLYKLNALTADYVPEAGDLIWLR